MELLESWANRVRAYRDPQQVTCPAVRIACVRARTSDACEMQGVGTPSGAGEGAVRRMPASLWMRAYTCVA